MPICRGLVLKYTLTVTFLRAFIYNGSNDRTANPCYGNFGIVNNSSAKSSQHLLIVRPMKAFKNICYVKKAYIRAGLSQKHHITMLSVYSADIFFDFVRGRAHVVRFRIS